MRAVWFKSTSAVVATTVVFDVASSSTYQAAVSTYNWSHTVANQPNRILLVFVSIFAAGTVSNITYNSVGLTFVNADANGIYRIECWRLFAPTVGANSIAVTLSGSLTSTSDGLSYYNTDQAALDAQTTANGTGNPASKSITTVYNRCTVVGGLSTQTAAGVTSHSGQNSRTSTAGALGTSAADDFGDVSPAGAKTLQWDNITVAQSWAVALVSLRPPATQALTGSLTFSGSVAKQTNWSRAGSLTFTGTLTKTTLKALAGAVTFVGSVAKAITRTLTGALTFTGTLTKLITRSLTGALTFVGTIAKTPKKALSGALTFSGSITRVVGKSLTAALTFSGSIAKAITRTLTGALTFSGALAKMTLKALAGALTLSGTITKAIGHTLAGALTFAGSCAKQTGKLCSASLTFVGSLVATLIHAGGTLYTITLTAALTFTGSIGKKTFKTFLGTLGTIGAGVGSDIIIVGEKIAKRIKGIIYEEIE